MIILSFLVGMKVLKIFRESSGRFRSFDWYESSKDFWRVECSFLVF